MLFNAGALTATPVNAGAAPQLRVAVIVASIRRSEEIGHLLTHLARQSQAPCAIILSVEGPGDLPPNLPGDAEIVMGPKGLTRQRNRGLERALPVSDVVAFFDDDYIPADDAIAEISRLFLEHPDIVGATGLVLRDGVKHGGISYDEAVAALCAHGSATVTPAEPIPTAELYGCNMAFRSAAVGVLRFDETLPLYGWQEDVDFTGQMMRLGRTVRTTAFTGVHRGVNKGRSRGIALGYSQMVNPTYLVRKGTMRPTKAVCLMAKNFLANHVRLIRPEPFIDRAGRCKGNWLGILDMLRLRLDPQRVLAF